MGPVSSRIRKKQTKVGEKEVVVDWGAWEQVIRGCSICFSLQLSFQGLPILDAHIGPMGLGGQRKQGILGLADRTEDPGESGTEGAVCQHSSASVDFCAQ